MKEDIEKVTKEEIFDIVSGYGAFFVGKYEVKTATDIVEEMVNDIEYTLSDDEEAEDEYFGKTIKDLVLDYLRGFKAFENGHVFDDPCDNWYGIKFNVNGRFINLIGVDIDDDGNEVENDAIVRLTFNEIRKLAGVK